MQGHGAFECKSGVSCRNCRGGHHISLCGRPRHESSNIGSSKEPIPNVRSTMLNPQATTWVGSTDSGERVALQTAVAKIKGDRDGTVRVLFDACSHQSFVTSKTVSNLGLRSVKKEKLSLKTLGANEAEVKVRDVVEIDLFSLKGSKSCRIQCYVVDDIATIPNERMDIVKKNFDHLKQIYFSDATRHGDLLQVDILIGANFLWEFMSGQTIRGGGGTTASCHEDTAWLGAFRTTESW